MKVICQCPSCKVELKFDNSTDRVINCPKCSYSGRTAEFKEVPIKTVYCPNCSDAVIIRLNRASKVITCPKCKRTEVAGKYSDTLPIRDPKNYPEDDEGTSIKTEIGGSNIYKPAKLQLIKDDDCWTDKSNITIELKRGSNTLGRKSPNSSSSIQLPTIDSYIGRNHAIIDVVMKSDSTFEHRLSDNNSKNGTFLNGVKIEPNEVFILTPNDTIRLGHTVLKFIIDE